MIILTRKRTRSVKHHWGYSLQITNALYQINIIDNQASGVIKLMNGIGNR